MRKKSIVVEPTWQNGVSQDYKIPREYICSSLGIRLYLGYDVKGV